MKRILLVSSLYPADDIQFKNNTAVCHYFAKEWVKTGYEVRAIHLYNEYPVFFYPLLKLAKNILADKVPAAILSKRMHREHTYEMDGITVTRIPAFKMMPHGDYSEKVVRRIADRIDAIIREEQFEPDYILGHFLLPGIRVVAALKEKHPGAVSTVALHGKERQIRPSVLQSLPRIDYVGYRSYPIKRSFEAVYGERPGFMCMSGIPADYCVDDGKEYANGVHHFLYVGNLMQRKYPEVLVPAVSRNYPDGDFTITYLGDGNARKGVEAKMAECGVGDQVVFGGRVKRDEVVRRMDAADVFIMVSAEETFGLVYLEAMARGCIAVASSDEGMDGVIVDGENGFLCKAGDSEELARIVARIKNMDRAALQAMSVRAIATARSMTDSRMAESYLRELK